MTLICSHQVLLQFCFFWDLTHVRDSRLQTLQGTKKQSFKAQKVLRPNSKNQSFWAQQGTREDAQNKMHEGERTERACRARRAKAPRLQRKMHESPRDARARAEKVVREDARRKLHERTRATSCPSVLARVGARLQEQVSTRERIRAA